MIANISVRSFDKLGKSDAISLAARAWVDMLDSGAIGDERVAVNPEHPIVVAYDDDVPIGFIHFYDEPNFAISEVHIGWVSPAYRRCGLYKNHLWPALVEHAQKVGNTRINGGIATGNTVMKQAMDMLGRRMQYMRFKYDVPTRI